MSADLSGVPVSAIVPVKNEAGNIRPCLEQLAWADEVFVVDSQSTDGTAEMAASMGAQVVQFHFSGALPKKKNWSLENLPFRNEWVLIVDADERITPELAREIADAVQRHDVDGYFVNRRFHFLGRWIKHCGYYPSWNLRLFRHSRGRYERIECPEAHTGDNEVHEHVILDGKSAYLSHDMLHYAYPDLATWVAKHNRYSEWEAHAAERLRRAGQGDRLTGCNILVKRMLKRLYIRLPLRFVLRFLYAYFLRLGILDGRPGFVMCALLSYYDFLSWAKTHELRLRRRTPGVEAQPPSLPSEVTQP